MWALSGRDWRIPRSDGPGGGRRPRAERLSGAARVPVVSEPGGEADRRAEDKEEGAPPGEPLTGAPRSVWSEGSTPPPGEPGRSSAMGLRIGGAGAAPAPPAQSITQAPLTPRRMPSAALLGEDSPSRGPRRLADRHRQLVGSVSRTIQEHHRFGRARRAPEADAKSHRNQSGGSPGNVDWHGWHPGAKTPNQRVTHGRGECYPDLASGNVAIGVSVIERKSVRYSRCAKHSTRFIRKGGAEVGDHRRTRRRRGRRGALTPASTTAPSTACRDQQDSRKSDHAPHDTRHPHLSLLAEKSKTSRPPILAGHLDRHAAELRGRRPTVRLDTQRQRPCARLVLLDRDPYGLAFLGGCQHPPGGHGPGLRDRL